MARQTRGRDTRANGGSPLCKVFPRRSSRAASIALLIAIERGLGGGCPSHEDLKQGVLAPEAPIVIRGPSNQVRRSHLILVILLSELDHPSRVASRRPHLAGFGVFGIAPVSSLAEHGKLLIRCVPPSKYHRLGIRLCSSSSILFLCPPHEHPCSTLTGMTADGSVRLRRETSVCTIKERRVVGESRCGRLALRVGQFSENVGLRAKA